MLEGEEADVVAYVTRVNSYGEYMNEGNKRLEGYEDTIPLNNEDAPRKQPLMQERHIEKEEVELREYVSASEDDEEESSVFDRQAMVFGEIATKAIVDWEQKTLNENPTTLHLKSMPCLSGLGLQSSGILSYGQRLGAGKTSITVSVLGRSACSLAVASRMQSKPTILEAITSALLFGTTAEFSGMGMKKTPFLQNQVVPSLEGISVGGSRLDIPAGIFELRPDWSDKIFIDSGTTIILNSQPVAGIKFEKEAALLAAKIVTHSGDKNDILSLLDKRNSFSFNSKVEDCGLSQYDFFKRKFEVGTNTMDSKIVEVVYRDIEVGFVNKNRSFRLDVPPNKALFIEEQAGNEFVYVYVAADRDKVVIKILKSYWEENLIDRTSYMECFERVLGISPEDWLVVPFEHSAVRDDLINSYSYKSGSTVRKRGYRRLKGIPRTFPLTIHPTLLNSKCILLTLKDMPKWIKISKTSVKNFDPHSNWSYCRRQDSLSSLQQSAFEASPAPNQSTGFSATKTKWRPKHIDNPNSTSTHP
ncbi:hypothetical protein SUGI_0004060 [Cryptomeria japonica]|nr:hypothetical protein SUGI_0004060 [Cryptomeria japonica]